jgi:hypothetical protein
MDGTENVEEMCRDIESENAHNYVTLRILPCFFNLSHVEKSA